MRKLALAGFSPLLIVQIACPAHALTVRAAGAAMARIAKQKGPQGIRAEMYRSARIAECREAVLAGTNARISAAGTEGAVNTGHVGRVPDPSLRATGCGERAADDRDTRKPSRRPGAPV